MDQIHEIIEQLRKKDYSSFDTFYELTKKQVFFAIISIVRDQDLTEDLMQDTYVKFLEKIDQYRPNENPYAYLSRIGRNLAINTYNRRKKEVVSEEIFETIPSEETVDEFEDDQNILKILDLLDKDEREVVTLHVINELKFRVIADTMDKPLGTVLGIYNKALKKLKKEIGDVL